MYSQEQLKLMDAAAISICSQRHIQSVIEELIETALAAAPTPAEPPEAVVRDAVAAERESCAKVCEKISDEYDENEGLKYAELRTDAATGCGDCASAIRARGEKGQS